MEVSELIPVLKDIKDPVAASMVSLAALVLTITMVVVQLAMGQFSPRIVQRILQDKPSQFAIGAFKAEYFGMLERAIFSDSTLAHWRHQLSLDYLRDQVAKILHAAEQAAGIYSPDP